MFISFRKKNSDYRIIVFFPLIHPSILHLRILVRFGRVEPTPGSTSYNAGVHPGPMREINVKRFDDTTLYNRNKKTTKLV